LDSSQ